MSNDRVKTVVPITAERLSMFGVKPQDSPIAIDPAAIEQMSQDHGFPSRQARPPVRSDKPPGGTSGARPRRYYRTGRNQAITFKATAEISQKLYRMADEQGKSVCAILEEAIESLARQHTKSGRKNAE